MKLPKPVGWRILIGGEYDYFRERRTAEHAALAWCAESPIEPVYSADQLRAVRDVALEEAAHIAETSKKYTLPERISAAIRALKEKKE